MGAKYQFYKLLHLPFIRGTIKSIESTPNENAAITLPCNIIIGLLAACVFNEGSVAVKSDDDYYLSYDSSVITEIIHEIIDGQQHVTSIVEQGNVAIFPLKDYWGREDDIKNFLSMIPVDKGKHVQFSVTSGEKIHFHKAVVIDRSEFATKQKLNGNSS